MRSTGIQTTRSSELINNIQELLLGQILFITINNDPGTFANDISFGGIVNVVV